MATIRISEADAERDLAGLLARVRAGAEVVIEKEAAAAVVVRAVANPAVRRLSESLGLARSHASGATLDGDYSRDLEAAIESHREPLDVPWD